MLNQENSLYKLKRLFGFVLFLLFCELLIIVSSVFILSLSPVIFIATSFLAFLTCLVLYFLYRKIFKILDDLSIKSSLIESESFVSLFERSPVAYLIVNKDGAVVKSNPAAIKLFQANTDNITNLNFFSVLVDKENFDTNIIKHKIVSPDITLNEVEAVVKTFNNSEIWVLLSAYNYNSRNQEYMIALIDINEQKKVDVAKSEFLALATHQLRTPIAAIRWNVELLKKKLLVSPEKSAIYLDKIERNVFRTINLIKDFLSVSKLEMGSYATKPEVVDLNKFFTTIIDEFSELITDKKLQVNYETGQPDLAIKIDKGLFHIVVSNLISNAVKYTNQNGNLNVSYEMQNETLFITIADDGIGVPESEKVKLFNKFFRASNARNHKAEGTGLGLYVVKQAVQLLNGSIKVDSGENRGTKFYITIPVDVVSVV